LTAPADRRKALEILDAAVADGERAHKVAELLDVGLTTLQRWRRQFAAVGDGLDRRKGSHRLVSHCLSDEERQRILFTCNDRVLHAQSQVHRRGRARPPQQPRPVPRLEARGANEVWSWDITFLPTSARGVWLYLYLVIDVWSRKVVAWDVADREEAQIAADLVSRACLTGADQQGPPPAIDPPCR
jgi:putative transposase